MSPPTYTAVGSTIGYIQFGRASTYSCSNVSTGTTSFTAMPGDIIIVCILNGTNGQLGAAAAIPGASVLHNKEPCTTLPTTVDLSTTNGFVSQSDLTLLVSLGVIKIYNWCRLIISFMQTLWDVTKMVIYWIQIGSTALVSHLVMQMYWWYVFLYPPTRDINKRLYIC